MIEVVKDYEGFLALEEKWDALWSRAKDVTFFQTFRYNRIAWDCFGKDLGQLFVILHIDEKTGLDAIFPFYVDKKKRLRFINDIHTDFCNIISTTKITYDLMFETWEYILKEKCIKALFLDNLLQSSPIISYWKTFGKNAFVFSQTEHSYLKCQKSENPINSLQHLSSKKKKKLDNILEKQEFVEIKIFKIEIDKYPIGEVEKLIGEMEKSGKRAAQYFNPLMTRFIEEIYEQGLIEIAILYEKEIPVSLSFAFKDTRAHKYMRWIIIYLDKKYNLWNNIYFLAEKIKNYDCIIDFGRGGYDYKMTNFHPYVENLYRFMYSKTKWGNWYVIWKMVASHLRKTLGKYRKG